MSKHKVFISFHHENDQVYKDALVKLGEENDIFIDGSVEMGEIPENWTDQKIREYIRDSHLADTTVTILLVGTETKIESILIGRYIQVCMMVKLTKNQD